MVVAGLVGQLRGALPWMAGASAVAAVAAQLLVEWEGAPAVQVDGYPIFCQDDWRNWEERYRPYDTVLFQLGCDWDRWIAIDDGGRMYFFIPSENLAAGDFSDIMYWWDCG